MHIAILMANTDESEFAQTHPKDGEKWQAFLAPHCIDCRFRVFAVKDGIFPTNISIYDGLIITGSPASVHDFAPWIGELSTLIRKAVSKRIPIYGACFGHQIIALALGGEVTKNPGGWIFGTTKTNVIDARAHMRAGSLRQYAAHAEQVTKLPKGAQIILENLDCPIGGFSIGNHVLTTQYHPEMTAGFIADLIEELAEIKPDHVIKAARESLNDYAENTPVAQSILNFIKKGEPTNWT